ncbi:hypothetical protein VSR01_31740 [Actinacidiphila sp. DG2A-62]|uniref:hypothetical protein n=1 Tax=Actinacidiphila sp. DG2A-62 TaxID=3108821 RepID=UPI002DBA8DC1|nr:hypothetical protein [Actinacidiphila sp. DG2A-62]MEC3997819.1 hypothetical protein [Actinacidiphila sp. DG2A-62]
MAESVHVSCPACGREHGYSAPTFPCACGTPLAPPIRRGAAPVLVRHRSWEDSWVRLRCPDCGRTDQWPQPEFDCACGALVRLPVAGADESAGSGEGTAEPAGDAASRPADPSAPASATASAAPAAPAAPTAASPPTAAVTPAGPVVPGAPAAYTAGRSAAPEPAGQAPPPPTPRPPFHPVTIRTARDALTAAAQYLKWLGFAEVRLAGDRTANGIDLRGDGLVAQVDPATLPTPLREVECLWLNCAHEDAVGAFFSLAGYAHDARMRADQLGVPLFVMDLTGTPQPVNDAADELIRRGPA